MPNTYDNNNSGSLFRNDRKNAPNQPDYTGNAIIDGKAKKVSAWIKTSRDGTKKFLSLSFNDPQPAPQQGKQYGAQPFIPNTAPQYNPRGMQQTGQMPAAPLNSPDGEDMPF